jgi:serine/threonine-protein kinase
VRVCPICRRSFEDTTIFCPQDATVLSLQPGTILLKKYMIVSEIARGGMAVVYRARHVHYDEEMALKILKEADQDAFVAEAHVLRRLKHPHIVRVEDADFLEDGRPFIAMEFIDGEDLAARLLRTVPMLWEEALRIAAEACCGLAAAHAAGMIHRDIKPKNILIARGADTVKLIDFGIAKVRKEAGIGFTGVQQGTTGFFLGTPRYASPEQALLNPLDGRTDIYSMGLVLYEMLAGRPPSGGDSDEAILENRRRSWHPEPPHRIIDEVPVSVSSVMMRALEYDRAARYQTAREMQNACESVRAVLIGEETRRTPPEAPHAMASKAEGKAATGSDDTRPSAEPSAGPTGQPRVPVTRNIRRRAVLVVVLADCLGRLANSNRERPANSEPYNRSDVVAARGKREASGASE